MKRDLIVAVLLTFCFAVTLFTVVPTIGSPDAGDYDPWLDYNDDGEIDMRDIGPVARAYGSNGTPINKTDLLLELQAKIDALNSTVIALLDQISGYSEGVVNIKDCYGLTTSAASGTVTLDFDNPFNSVDYYLFTKIILAADFDPGSGNIIAGTIVDGDNVVKTIANFTVEVWFGETLKGADVDLFYIAIEMGI